VATSESGAYSGTGSATYRYDRRGLARIVTDAFGSNRYAVYDLTGRKTGDVDHFGRLTEYRYDSNDRLVATIGWATALSAAQLATLADPATDIDIATLRPAAAATDAWNWTVYDREGRVLQRIDATGASITYDYDATGRLLRETRYANRLDVQGFKATPPTAVILPTLDSARDIVTRTFYDRDGNVIGVLDGEGYLSRATFDAAGNRVTATSFTKRVTDTLRASASFGALVSDVGTDANDRTMRYVYDGQGQLRFTVDSVNRVTEYVYTGPRAGDASGTVRQTIAYARPIATLASYSVATVAQGLASVGATGDAANRRSFAVHDGKGNLTFTIDAAGSVTGYAYDVSGRVVRTTRFANSYATATLPTHEAMAQWQATQATHADNRVTRSYYAARGELRFAVDAMGYVTRFDYDAAGRNTTVVRFDTALVGVGDDSTIASIAAAQSGSSVVTTTSYDARGRVFEATDAAGTITRYTYNVDGTVQSATQAYGTADAVRTQYDYDAAGRVVARTDDADGLKSVTRYAYDGFGNLLSQTAPDGTGTTSFTYDRAGRVLTRTDALGQVQSYDYDGFGQRVRTIDAAGAATYSYYDRAGRVVAVRDAENYVTETGYTAFDQIATLTRRATRATNAASTTTLPTVPADAKDAVTQFAYDLLGRVVRTIDAEGFAENSSYNSFGEVAQASNKLGAVTTRRYDRRGQVASDTIEKDAYNAAGSLIASEASGVTTRYEYDARGNRTRMTEAAGLPEQRVTDYSYDALDRLIEKRGAEVAYGVPGSSVNAGTASTTENYLYDRRGNLTRRTDANGRHSWFYYDALDRKIGQVDAVGAYVAYRYDQNGGLIGVRAYINPVPGSQMTTDTPPVAAGSYRETTYVNDALGRRVSSTVTGARTGTWDAASGSYVLSTAPLTEAIVYDAVGNVVRTTDAAGASTLSYYDRLGRKVAQVDPLSYLTEWTLDAEGNTLSERRYGAAVAGATEANRPQGVTGTDDRVTDFTYDRNGRRLTETRKDVVAWSVDPATGALTDVSGDARITYTYNALGLVTSKREATGDTSFYTYDRAGRLTAEQRANLINSTTDEAIPKVAYFYDGTDNLVRTVEGDDRITTHRYDAQGRKTAMVDAMGVARYYFYDRVGNLIAEAYSRRTSSNALLYEGMIYRLDNVGRVRGQIVATNWTRSGGVFTSLTTANAPPEAQQSYNVFGEIVARTIAGQQQEQHDYDAAGRLWRSTGGDGTWRYYLYDGAGRQTMVLESDGSRDLRNLTLDEVVALATVDGRLIGGPATGIVATATEYDRRGQVARVHSLQRQSTNGVSGGSDLRSARTYTAFGEVATETDARGGTTVYGYNRMGRVISIGRPVVLGADLNETGIFETRYYDIAGRLAGTKDGNGNINTRRLAGGTGYGGTAELVTAEYHADGGRVWMRYDDAGNLVKRTDELGRATYQTFDKLGRLLTTSAVDSRDVAHSYTYDSLGRRLTHSQAGRDANDRETTDYDNSGRVISTRAFGGDVTTTSYAWDSTITIGLGASGGWKQTTSYSNGRTTIEVKDGFGRLTQQTDMGGNVATTSYDQAGRVRQITGLETQTFTWFNTGLLARQTSDMGAGYVRSEATTNYDQVGNRVKETFTRDGVSYRNTDVQYDLQNRMRFWEEIGDVNMPAASMAWTYDRNGNIRQTIATKAILDAQGNVARTTTEQRLFAYDSMNRMTIEGGAWNGSSIVRGTGTEITYRVDGSRATTLGTFRAKMWVRNPDDDGIDTRNLRQSGEIASASGAGMVTPFAPVDRTKLPVLVYYDAERRETFTWRDDGQLATVQVEETGGWDNGDGTASSDQVLAGAGSAEYQYDALGRQVRQIDRSASGSAIYDRSLYYDYGGRGQITYEVTVAKQGTDTINTSTSTDYGSGADYLLGAVAKVTVTSTVNGSNSSTTTTTNSYQWRDAAQLTGTVTTKTNSSTVYSSYSYSGVGQLDSVWIGGERPRTVTFVNDLAGQVIRRDEADYTGSTGDPHEIWYRHGGREIGYVGNNGSASDSYSESIRRRATKGPDTPGPFAQPGGQPRGPYFAETIDRINSYEQGGAGRSYTVQGGETLAGIAAQLWGDASLWYKLATANGLTADSALTTGQVLTVPAGIVRSTYNADSYKPYDPSDVMGDLNPVTPTPKAKRNKCGAFG
ncbi:hypothetical protein DMC47_28025, partial [Nostoc sp. 3335mG]